MKLPEDLKDSDKRWDRWRAFHWNYGYDASVVLFDTGEVIVTTCGHKVRGNCYSLGIRLVAIGDPACPSLKTPDGRTIVTAWLTQRGLQEVLVDEETGYIVALGKKFKTKDKPAIPKRFISDYGLCRAYFPGPGLPPIGAGTISVSPPALHKEWFTPEQIEHLKDLRAAGTAIHAMDGQKKSYVGPLSIDRLLDVRDPSELSTEECAYLATKGLPRPVFEFDHLRVA